MSDSEMSPASKASGVNRLVMCLTKRLLAVILFSFSGIVFVFICYAVVKAPENPFVGIMAVSGIGVAGGAYAGGCSLWSR